MRKVYVVVGQIIDLHSFLLTSTNRVLIHARIVSLFHFVGNIFMYTAYNVQHLKKDCLRKTFFVNHFKNITPSKWLKNQFLHATT